MCEGGAGSRAEDPPFSGQAREGSGDQAAFRGKLRKKQEEECPSGGTGGGGQRSRGGATQPDWGVGRAWHGGRGFPGIMHGAFTLQGCLASGAVLGLCKGQVG